ncbi:hypothetical protein TYRP_020725 [Tyrophagus putrescentiae]|nr:hypothetical protein TYRP_020725 [Tyrophagus putrescentiae]
MALKSSSSRSDIDVSPIWVPLVRLLFRSGCRQWLKICRTESSSVPTLFEDLKKEKNKFIATETTDNHVKKRTSAKWKVGVGDQLVFVLRQKALRLEGVWILVVLCGVVHRVDGQVDVGVLL